METEQNITFDNKKRRPWLLSLLFDNHISMCKYVLRTGFISLIPSLIIAMILAFTGVITEETSPEYKVPAIGLLIGMIVISPILETLLMGGGLWVLSFITKRPVRLAAISAIVWASVHSLLVPISGLVVIWPFFVFSCSYLGWRRRSYWQAILVTSCVHAFQNTLPAIALIAAM